MWFVLFMVVVVVLLFSIATNLDRLAKPLQRKDPNWYNVSKCPKCGTSLTPEDALLSLASRPEDPLKFEIGNPFCIQCRKEFDPTEVFPTMTLGDWVEVANALDDQGYYTAAIPIEEWVQE